MARYLVRGTILVNVNDTVEADSPREAIKKVGEMALYKASSTGEGTDGASGLTAYDDAHDPDDPNTPIINIPETEAQSQPD